MSHIDLRTFNLSIKTESVLCFTSTTSQFSVFSCSSAAPPSLSLRFSPSTPAACGACPTCSLCFYTTSPHLFSRKWKVIEEDWSTGQWMRNKRTGALRVGGVTWPLMEALVPPSGQTDELHPQYYQQNMFVFIGIIHLFTSNKGDVYSGFCSYHIWR